MGCCTPRSSKMCTTFCFSRGIFWHSRGPDPKNFLGTSPQTPFSFCFTSISYQHFLFISTVKQWKMLFLNAIQCFPINNTLNEIFIGQLPKCKAKSYTITNVKCDVCPEWKTVGGRLTQFSSSMWPLVKINCPPMT